MKLWQYLWILLALVLGITLSILLFGKRPLAPEPLPPMEQATDTAPARPAERALQEPRTEALP